LGVGGRALSGWRAGAAGDLGVGGRGIPGSGGLCRSPTRDGGKAAHHDGARDGADTAVATAAAAPSTAPS
ncbi:MAG: hypothetical protein WBC31_02000, partial [Candidatus Phosphoribacter baldrii]